MAGLSGLLQSIGFLDDPNDPDDFSTQGFLTNLGRGARDIGVGLGSLASHLVTNPTQIDDVIRQMPSAIAGDYRRRYTQGDLAENIYDDPASYLLDALDAVGVGAVAKPALRAGRARLSNFLDTPVLPPGFSNVGEAGVLQGGGRRFARFGQRVSPDDLPIDDLLTHLTEEARVNRNAYLGRLKTMLGPEDFPRDIFDFSQEGTELVGEAHHRLAHERGGPNEYLPLDRPPTDADPHLTGDNMVLDAEEALLDKLRDSGMPEDVSTALMGEIRGMFDIEPGVAQFDNRSPTEKFQTAESPHATGELLGDYTRRDWLRDLIGGMGNEVGAFNPNAPMRSWPKSIFKEFPPLRGETALAYEQRLRNIIGTEIDMSKAPRRRYEPEGLSIRGARKEFGRNHASEFAGDGRTPEQIDQQTQRIFDDGMRGRGGLRGRIGERARRAFGNERGAIEPGAEIGRNPERYYDVWGGDPADPRTRVAPMPSEEAAALKAQAEQIETALSELLERPMRAPTGNQWPDGTPVMSEVPRGLNRDRLDALSPDERAAVEVAMERLRSIKARLAADSQLIAQFDPITARHYTGRTTPGSAGDPNFVSDEMYRKYHPDEFDPAVNEKPDEPVPPAERHHKTVSEEIQGWKDILADTPEADKFGRLEAKLRLKKARGNLMPQTNTRPGDLEKAGSRIIAQDNARLREADMESLLRARQSLYDRNKHIRGLLNDYKSKGRWSQEELRQINDYLDELIDIEYELAEIRSQLPWDSKASVSMEPRPEGVGPDDIEDALAGESKGVRFAARQGRPKGSYENLDRVNDLTPWEEMALADDIYKGMGPAAVQKGGRRAMRREQIDPMTAPEPSTARRQTMEAAGGRSATDTAPTKGAATADVALPPDEDLWIALDLAREEHGRKAVSAKEVVDALTLDPGDKKVVGAVRKWMKAQKEADSAAFYKSRSSDDSPPTTASKGGTTKAAGSADSPEAAAWDEQAETLRAAGIGDERIVEILGERPAPATVADDPMQSEAAEVMRAAGISEKRIREILDEAGSAPAPKAEEAAPTTRRRGKKSEAKVETEGTTKGSAKMPSEGKLTAARKKLRDANGVNPSAQQIADELGVGDDKGAVRKIRSWLKEQPRTVK